MKNHMSLISSFSAFSLFYTLLTPYQPEFTSIIQTHVVYHPALV